MATTRGVVVTTRMLHGLEAFLKSKKVDYPYLVARAGLDIEEISDPDGFVSFSAVVELFEQAAAATGDDAFGLHLAQANPMGPIGLFRLIMLNSRTVRDALTARARYTGLVSNAYQTSLEKQDGTEVYIWYLPPLLGPHTQYIDYAMMLLVDRVRLLVGDRAWKPLFVEFDHKKPRSIADFEQALGGRLKFGCEHPKIALDPTMLSKPVSGADPQLLGELESLAKNLRISSESEEDFLDTVSRHIALALPASNATLGAIAAAVGVSPRLLQSRLAQSGRTFRELVDRTRAQMAYRLLLDTKTPLSEVALMLGFSELSAFSRAARGWFGRSPSDVRKQADIPARE